MKPADAVPVVLPREAAAVYAGLSLSTMVRLVARGEFPKPRKLSQGRVGWLSREIDMWAEALPISDIAPGPSGASGAVG